jgi:hypothetical protein
MVYRKLGIIYLSITQSYFSAISGVTLPDTDKRNYEPVYNLPFALKDRKQIVLEYCDYSTRAPILEAQCWEWQDENWISHKSVSGG